MTVFEEKHAIGGAAKTEYPFSKAPGVGISSGAYLLGVMQPELIALLGADIPLIRRDPHYFLPTLKKGYLLFGSDEGAMHRQFLAHFSENDWKANHALVHEIGMLREDLAPSWLQPPQSVEATAERYIRPALRQIFLNLVSRPVEEYLDRFGFKSDLLVAMYAVTDGFSGLTGGFGSPRTGMNFLVHNMCRLPGSSGTWMVVEGGMGRLTQELGRLARKAGVSIETGSGVAGISLREGRAEALMLEDGREVKSDVIVCNADPFRLRELVGAENLPADFNAKLDGFRRMGTTLKVNMALDRLPTFTCLPGNQGQHNATIHLLPQEGDIISQIRSGFAQVMKGELADFPTIEWYIHSQADPSLKDAKGRHNSALFVQWVPYALNGSRWEDKEEGYVKHLFDIVDRFAPGFSDSVVDTFVLTPPKIEKHFGIRYGHIHHVDNSFGFDKRMPYSTPIAGLYSCSAGCHPAGSVIGSAGHNAAMKILDDLRG